MTILSFLCRLIPGSRCADEPTRPETAASRTSADLGQREAQSEALGKEQLKNRLDQCAVALFRVPALFASRLSRGSVSAIRGWITSRAGTMLLRVKNC